MKSVGKETNHDPLVQDTEEMIKLKKRIETLDAKIDAYEANPTASTFAQSDLQYWRDELILLRKKENSYYELILLRTEENILLASKQGK